VGKLVAARLGRPIVSTDQEIVRRAGSAIPDIVAAHGWDYFRDLESQVCQELAARDNLVIDTGGGLQHRHGRPFDRRFGDNDSAASLSSPGGTASLTISRTKCLK
jgi:hypothetical protein